MTTNGVLSLLSVVVGLVLIGGAVIGGNVASTLNMTVGTLFVLSGFFHVFTLDRPANVLGFGMTNVMFSFVMGLLIACFGMYGRVSGTLPHDNPYWRRRHPRGGARGPRGAAPGPAGGPRPGAGTPGARSRVSGRESAPGARSGQGHGRLPGRRLRPGLTRPGGTYGGRHARCSGAPATQAHRRPGRSDDRDPPAAEKHR